MKLILMGYMASGKSVIAKYLSKKVGVKNIDLDHYIEHQEGQTIQDIFKNKGEIYFRIIENKYLKELLEEDNEVIIAVGGGTPCYANNIQLIKEKANSIYLKTSIATLLERLLQDQNKRPLVKDIAKEDLAEFIAKHLFERNDYYDKADQVVLVDNKNMEQITDEIIKKVYSK